MLSKPLKFMLFCSNCNQNINVSVNKSILLQVFGTIFSVAVQFLFVFTQFCVCGLHWLTFLTKKNEYIYRVEYWHIFCNVNSPWSWPNLTCHSTACYANRDKDEKIQIWRWKHCECWLSQVSRQYFFDKKVKGSLIFWPLPPRLGGSGPRWSPEIYAPENVFCCPIERPPRLAMEWMPYRTRQDNVRTQHTLHGLPGA